MGKQYSRDELIDVADRRLNPALTNPNYLVLRRRKQILGAWITELAGENLRVLDIGGRYQPYRPLLQNRLSQYVAIDVLATPLVDVVGRGEKLPFRSDTFDLVIATGVFEYFPEPHVAAAQIYDVLKPGGVLLMSVAAVCPRAVDEEHWRYMRAGLRSILSRFSHVEIVPEVFSFGGFCRIVNVSFNIFAKYEFVRKIFTVTIFPAMNIIGLGLESMALSTNDLITGNYSALARK
jgi:SAM-dependent methyltransferase